MLCVRQRSPFSIHQRPLTRAGKECDPSPSPGVMKALFHAPKAQSRSRERRGGVFQAYGCRTRMPLAHWLAMSQSPEHVSSMQTQILLPDYGGEYCIVEARGREDASRSEVHLGTALSPSPPPYDLLPILSHSPSQHVVTTSIAPGALHLPNS